MKLLQEKSHHHFDPAVGPVNTIITSWQYRSTGAVRTSDKGMNNYLMAHVRSSVEVGPHTWCVTALRGKAFQGEVL